MWTIVILLLTGCGRASEARRGHSLSLTKKTLVAFFVVPSVAPRQFETSLDGLRTSSLVSEREVIRASTTRSAYRRPRTSTVAPLRRRAVWAS